ncbi:MAG: hypothetical protein Q9208_000071 [Pyrenodesmia sp. 3 TL-2023]
MEDLISPVWTNTADPAVLLCSNRYVAVGCDLRNTAKLRSILDDILDLANCLVLCIAEVSLTYMDVDAADSLIWWAAQYEEGEKWLFASHISYGLFCLLEQYLPDGDKHPFTQKMLQHFDNLNTPLRCVRTYPTLVDQEDRFRQAGYHSAHARSLWDLWQDKSFVGPELRRHLNGVEPFDEWEEFALFSMHYFLLEAVKTRGILKLDENAYHVVRNARKDEAKKYVCYQRDNVQVLSSSSDGRRRKFGALILSSENKLGFHGGIFKEKRTQTTDRYQLSGAEANCERLPDPPSDVGARACHTITRLHDGKDLLFGGRKSPDDARTTCWLRDSNKWRIVHESGLYRHCAAAVSLGENGEIPGVLVFGGRGMGGAFHGTWLLWRETKGWINLAMDVPRFGATMVATDKRQGLLIGGMTEDGILDDGVIEWHLSDGLGGEPSLQLLRREDIAMQLPPRMGACLVPSSDGLLLIGGISTTLLPQHGEMMRIRDVSEEDVRVPNGESSLVTKQTTIVEPVSLEFGSSRPLLVGHSAYSARAHWNQDIFTIHFFKDVENMASAIRWTADENAPLDVSSQINDQVEHPKAARIDEAIHTDIVRVKIDTARAFDDRMNEARPFVMEGLDIGSCTEKWTANELSQKLDPKRMVTVHEAHDKGMNFLQKNFQYVKKPFGVFLLQCVAGSKQYMRSLSTEKPADRPANFHEDFPELQEDFHLPEQLATVSRNHHSSPLRISGPVSMWLHYDVMANVLCQIRGTKIVVLYPPFDAQHFRIPPGSSSSPLNAFMDCYPWHIAAPGDIADLGRPYFRAILNPGDVLYIPPLWLHAAYPAENFSVSINVFFKNFKKGYYAAGRDVYGNRDLQAYENSRKGVEKMVKAFDGLPKDVASAYLERVAEELKEKALALRK